MVHLQRIFSYAVSKDYVLIMNYFIINSVLHFTHFAMSMALPDESLAIAICPPDVMFVFISNFISAHEWSCLHCSFGHIEHTEQALISHHCPVTTGIVNPFRPCGATLTLSAKFLATIIFSIAI